MRDGSRGLVKGRFGNALHLPLGDGMGVNWAEGTWKRQGTARMLDRGDEVPEICNLGYLDFTIEFWFKADGAQTAPGVVWEVRNEDNANQEVRNCPTGFNALVLDARRSAFVLRGKAFMSADRHVRWDQRLVIPTDDVRLNDGLWHHVAFTYNAVEHQVRHFLDGKLQPLPSIGGFLPLRGQLVTMRLGRDGENKQELVGLLDEVRISDVVRYMADFEPPGSFSRNYGLEPPKPAIADGPPLLFGSNSHAGPVALGSRKHLFTDDAMVANMDQNVRFTANPPTRIDATDFRSTKPWEPSPRVGAAIPDICSIWDDGDEVKIMYGNNGLYSGKESAICLAVSRDGLHWTKPDLGLFSWNNSTRNNIVLRNALQGTAIKDPNPQAPADERYKLMAWCMRRGFYVFISPDGAHWRRNETCALPFDPDGSIDFFWDDQAGIYRGYLRSLSNIENPSVVRGVVRTNSAEVLKPWPFKPVEAPRWVLSNNDPIWSLPGPSSGELPLIDTGGQVYRMKAVKYPWAPDVYLAFPWRYLAATNIRPGSLMMVSRDGENWQRYEPPYYFGSGWEFEGRKVLEALMEQGMIRRGDEIWQYGTIRFTEHGGALYGGVEHDGSGFDKLLRLTQRLDGFVSLDAGPTAGTVVTRLLTFTGDRLELNVAAEGAVRVALLDEHGRPLPGYALEDCDPIQADSVRQIVTWKGRPEVGRHAGQPVQVQFELRKAKLYAFRFVP
jgi:hypothetical protein